MLFGLGGNRGFKKIIFASLPQYEATLKVVKKFSCHPTPGRNFRAGVWSHPAPPCLPDIPVPEMANHFELAVL